MLRTTTFRVSLWLAIPIVVVVCDLAMAANHAPVLDASKSPVLTAENQNAGAPSGAVGTLVSTLVDFAVPTGQVDNVTDVDAGAKLGIAVTAANTNNGSWWYSKNNGTNWYALGAVTVKSARLLAADVPHAIYFQPNPSFYGTLLSAITFRAWDQTSGSNGSLANTTKNGGSTAFSTATDTASLTVFSSVVKYRILQVLPPSGSESIWANSINDTLTAVGMAYRDANTMNTTIAFISPNDVDPVVAGWLKDFVEPLPEGIAYLNGGVINNRGLIAGRFVRNDGTVGGIYVVDTTKFVDTPSGPRFPIEQITLQDDAPLLRHMNENGDLLYKFGTGPSFAVALRSEVGTYEHVGLPSEMTDGPPAGTKPCALNDATLEHGLQVVGSLISGDGVVYELQGTSGNYEFISIRTFATHRVYDINNAGIAIHQVMTNGESSVASYSVETDSSTVIWDIGWDDYPSNINEQGWISGSYGPNGGSFIYDPLTQDSWALDDLVYGRTPEDAALWFAQPSGAECLTDACDPITGFPVIYGGRGERTYVLFPESPNAP